MDVKNKYPSPPKGASASDTKKNQDVYPKISRKKEPIGTNGFLKNEQSRKLNLQRAKDIIKRPRAKGQYHGSAAENPKVVEAKSAEHGSVLIHGSKKENHLVNANHLLNFHYEPRDAQSRGRMTRNTNGNRWLPSVQKHKYNKEQFIQASYQFVVTANGNYSPYLIDPDVLVDWDLIEQIKIYSSENLSCPICLCTPIAGKMTRCGHVYCWPCILHYMHVSNKNGTHCKCPICYESVRKSDLRSVIEITQNVFNLGNTLNLRLMRREKGTVFAMPVVSKIRTPTTFLSVSEDFNNQIYSKLLIANVKDIVDIIQFERLQLELEFVDNPDCYIKQALGELLLRENKLLLEKLKESTNTVLTESMIEKETAKQTLQGNEGNKENTDTLCKNDTKSSTEQFPKTRDSASNDSQSTSGLSKFIYFYQAEDGQHLYLHAMNVKMLEMQYGGLEHCPPVITGKILEKEAGSYTEDLKRRLRYLSHLPLTCQFELVEIELKPPLVSEEILQSFRGQLNSRQKNRERRERQEKKREKKIMEEQNKRMGRYVTPYVNIQSHRHFPQWMPEQLPEESPLNSSTMSSVGSSTSSSSSFDEIASNQEVDHTHEQLQGPSFAEMLRNTGTRSKSISAWPSVVSSAQSKTCLLDTAIISSNEDEDAETYYVSPPLKNQSFGDALARALRQTNLLDPGTSDNGTTAGKKKNKHKKKRKATVLFATNMTRGS